MSLIPLPPSERRLNETRNVLDELYRFYYYRLVAMGFEKQLKKRGIIELPKRFCE